MGFKDTFNSDDQLKSIAHVAQGLLFRYARTTSISLSLRTDNCQEIRPPLEGIYVLRPTNILA